MSRPTPSVTVTATRTPTQLIVSSPFISELPPRARKLGGRWDPDLRAWCYDPRAEDAVRALYRRLYGADGVEPVRLCTIELTARREIRVIRGAIVAAGRELAYASGRDSGARTGAGVVLLSGVVTSGGSLVNWCTIVRRHTILRVLDVPVGAVETLQAEMEADGDQAEWSMRVADEDQQAEARRAALAAERVRLQARLDEIDAELSGQSCSSAAA